MATFRNANPNRLRVLLPISLAMAIVASAFTPELDVKDIGKALIDPSPNDMRFADFSSITIAYTNFRGRNMIMSDFRMAHLEKVDFTGADLKWSNFAGALICETTMPDGSLCELNCKLREPHKPTKITCPYLEREQEQ